MIEEFLHVAGVEGLRFVRKFIELPKRWGRKDPSVCAENPSVAPPCSACHGLGFVSHAEPLPPEFNIWRLNRHVHPDGRITWEGDCRICAIPREGRVYVPFAWTEHPP